MNTYSLSHYRSSWHIYRHDEFVNEIACSISQESDAMQFALQVASDDRPSRVVTMDHKGKLRVVATFGQG